MTSALTGLALILLIAVVTVALGALARLLAARLVTPRAEHSELSLAERVARGDALVARELRPDGVHPVARAVPPTGEAPAAPGPEPRRDLAVHYPEIAAHALR
jgi:hypothetical protein